MSVSLHRQWAESLSRSMDENQGIAAIVRRRGALDNWASLRAAPSARAEDELRYAITIAAANYHEPLARTCLTRALEVIAAGEQDERWNTWWSASRRVEHGRFLSAGELARSWFNDADINREQLSRASQELRVGAVEDRPVWTELAQTEYIHGVQLLMLSQDIVSAAESLHIRKQFNRVRRYHDWHVLLLDICRAEGKDTVLAKHFDDFFDEIRNPSFKAPTNDPHGNNLLGVPLLRLRLALIRWIYIERKPIAGNWRHIIGQIGY